MIVWSPVLHSYLDDLVKSNTHHLFSPHLTLLFLVSHSCLHIFHIQLSHSHNQIQNISLSILILFDNSIGHFSCLASSSTTMDNLVISLSLASTSTSRATTQSKWQVQKVFFLLLFDGKLFMEYIFIISRYLIVYYLPSGLFVLVSWTSFIIPPEVIIN